MSLCLVSTITTALSVADIKLTDLAPANAFFIHDSGAYRMTQNTDGTSTLTIQQQINTTDDCCIKGELNLDKKWQSDDLFYIIMNEIHPRFNKF